MAQDVGWCESVVVSFHLVWLVFLGFYPYMLLYENFFVAHCCVCIVVKRWERRLRGGCGEDAWSIKYGNVHIIYN